MVVISIYLKTVRIILERIIYISRAELFDKCLKPQETDVKFLHHKTTWYEDIVIQP